MSEQAGQDSADSESADHAVDDDALQKYRDKRDPRVTNEPFAAAGTPGGNTTTGDFVVHLHAATRRHYDLRIQVGGTLKSFAVPRGPSLNPKDRRLAVQTEDHPIEYLDFEDVIPEGNYGAGPMIVWDIGRVRYLENTAEVGLQKGKVDFELYGRKLQGRFALVDTSARMRPPPKQKQWLLLKKTDVHSGEQGERLIEEQPESVLSGLQVEQLSERGRLQSELLKAAKDHGAVRRQVDYRAAVPMACANDGARLDDRARLYELKLDGVRILGERRGSQVRLRYRSKRSAYDSYPEVARALRTAFVEDFIVDGEIVSFDDKGKPNFQRLAPRIHASRPFDVKRAAAEVPVVYLVFDLLQLGPWDLTQLPLNVRKELLAKLFPGKGLVRLLDHIDFDGRPLFSLCETRGMEGVVSKLRDGPYRFGPERSGDWVKHKCVKDADFVVVGWVGAKNNSKQVGALELASYRGADLVYRGRVGSGFSAETLERFKQLLPPLAIDEWQVVGEPLAIETGKRRTYLKPELVVSVNYLEWTAESRIRMGIFRGLRDDLSPKQCVEAPEDERLASLLPSPEPATAAIDYGVDGTAGVSGQEPGPIDRSGSERRAAGANAPRGLAKGINGTGSRVQLKNQDKVFWPEEGYTKGDLLNYYELIADVLLPHLANRPVMLVRHPDGVTGKSFYQWNTPKGTPSWIQTLQLRDEERDGKDVTTFLIDDVDSLLHIINLGCIPIHVLACDKETREHCDFLTIDFDIGSQPFKEAVLLALSLKDLLDELGLVGFPKTSGQSGLHVMIPLGPGVPFTVAKVMVELVGRLLQLRHPETSTMERRISGRGDRVYIDTGQTGRSRTIVAPYSVRAHRGATVSAPLLWEEVHLALKPEELTMFTLPLRVSEKGDPMAGLLTAAPDVVTAVASMERMLKGGSS